MLPLDNEGGGGLTRQSLINILLTGGLEIPGKCYSYIGLTGSASTNTNMIPVEVLVYTEK